MGGGEGNEGGLEWTSGHYRYAANFVYVSALCPCECVFDCVLCVCSCITACLLACVCVLAILGRPVKSE